MSNHADVRECWVNVFGVFDEALLGRFYADLGGNPNERLHWSQRGEVLIIQAPLYRLHVRIKTVIEHQK